MSARRKVILYIAMSLDGYIATPEGDLDFLSLVEQEGQDYGYADFYQTVDTIILGRKTYDKVLSMGVAFPHSGKETYVLTRTERPGIGTVRFYTDSLPELVRKLQNQTGNNIFVDGGAETVNQLLQENLVDEFYISIIPILLGSGISLFQPGRPTQLLKLVETKQFEKGLAQLHYIRLE
ncbi:dihydrofolate reductase family protein [Hymenobacter sp. BT491]|uniref:dihydrofolate reductase family protein n=1 Tax=Hymenobacter sp. BT491 TaxID=2766779 RepID=UPI001653B3B2|nr:dihydrofolate reductase family protein [Hymenobacter sp. BT491]MBC6988892.1 dihydrofolate reductase [Hymenobacter sp. BT491]